MAPCGLCSATRALWSKKLHELLIGRFYKAVGRYSPPIELFTYKIWPRVIDRSLTGYWPAVNNSGEELIYPSTLEIFLPMMLRKPVAFRGSNKRYSNPTPSPRYPSQRLAPFKLFLIKNRRNLSLSFLHPISVENPPLEGRWSTYNLGKGWSGTGTSKNSHNGPHPCLTLNYHTQKSVDLNPSLYQPIRKYLK